jgi:hypothetical protein
MHSLPAKISSSDKISAHVGVFVEKHNTPSAKVSEKKIIFLSRRLKVMAVIVVVKFRYPE